VKFRVFLNLALDGSESASHFSGFIPEERAPGTNNEQVGPRAELEVLAKRKILPFPGTKPRLSSQ